MERIDRWLDRTGAAALGVAVLAGPWLFGAWEMWWFWPLAALVFLSALCLGLRMMVAPDGAVAGRLEAPDLREVRLAAVCGLPFLVYAFVRAAQADVFMDAERSFLLFLLPWLTALPLLFGWETARRRVFLDWLLLDLLLLGLYGLINHALIGSRLVLWVDAYPQYLAERRACGTYFCPNHFAGVMELAFGLGAAQVAAPGTTARRKLAGALLVVVATAAVVLTKSRGGGLTLVAVGLAVLAWGVTGRRTAVRWAVRGAGIAALAAGLALFVALASAYTERFAAWFGPQPLRGRPAAEAWTSFKAHLSVTDRGRMIAGAMRAWGRSRATQLAGIGPGMHQNLWFHYAASPDGDRERGIAPAIVTSHFHSYEVHSDWVQLLEEYGLIGLAFFTAAAGTTVVLLVRRLRRCAAAPPPRRDGQATAAVMGALFAATAMAVHSLGDFNLQMPATGWLLAAILALGLAPSRRAAHGAEDETP